MPPELTYCICGCRRSSNLFLHKGSLVFLIIHPAYVQMSVAVLWSKASLSLAEPSISNESIWTATHTCHECGTEIFLRSLAQHSEMAYSLNNILPWSTGIKCYHHIHIVVVIRRQNSWAVQRAVLPVENMAAEVEFSVILAFAALLGRPCSSGSSLLVLFLFTACHWTLIGKSVLLLTWSLPLSFHFFYTVLDICSITGLKCIPVAVCACNTIYVLSLRATILDR